ncbi:hypothetical protein [uncultured Roseobacter sp.]|uniref:hypothetical protein n=1 Tax=uncultured Roseobacter sp. TaxID=114847 RepID=UPI0026097FE4|nr:hypothetical protein [uncultured Roseobacter sp.]
MSTFELIVFAICLLILGFLAGAIEASKGLPFKKKLIFWFGYLCLAAAPTFFLVQVWPDGKSTVSIYSSSDEENSLMGPITALALFAGVVAVTWFGRLAGNILKKRIFGTDLQ